MTESSMLLPILGSVAFGALLGTAYFYLLHLALRRHLIASMGQAVPLHLLRIILAVAGFWGLAQLGAWPLIAGLGGFVASRLVVQRFVPGEAP